MTFSLSSPRASPDISLHLAEALIRCWFHLASALGRLCPLFGLGFQSIPPPSSFSLQLSLLPHDPHPHRGRHVLYRHATHIDSGLGRARRMTRNLGGCTISFNYEFICRMGHTEAHPKRFGLHLSAPAALSVLILSPSTVRSAMPPAVHVTVLSSAVRCAASVTPLAVPYAFARPPSIPAAAPSVALSTVASQRRYPTRRQPSSAAVDRTVSRHQPYHQPGCWLHR